MAVYVGGFRFVSFLFVCVCVALDPIQKPILTLIFTLVVVTVVVYSKSLNGINLCACHLKIELKLFAICVRGDVNRKQFKC